MHPLLSLYYVAQDNPELQFFLVLLPKCQDHWCLSNSLCHGLCLFGPLLPPQSMFNFHRVSLSSKFRELCLPVLSLQTIWFTSLHALSNFKPRRTPSYTPGSDCGFPWLEPDLCTLSDPEW